jgi:hypothetical protein
LENDVKKIVIVGAGQLGSRHLQGLAKCKHKLRVYVLDTDYKALERAKSRWLEVAINLIQKTITYHTKLSDVEKNIDLTIVSTTAKNRVQLMISLKNHFISKFWILEKILVQSSHELNELLLIMKFDEKTWVNFPRRMLLWHNLIRDKLIKKNVLNFRLNAGQSWGLTCNALHFLDMFSWYSDETIQHISTKGMSHKWYETRRSGNWEVSGEIQVLFSGGSTATITDQNGLPCDPNKKIFIEDGNFTWSIDEQKGTAKRSDGLSISGRLPYQSETTPLLVDEILSTGYCKLPSLKKSEGIHRVFLDATLKHWQNTIDSKATIVPIT